METPDSIIGYFKDSKKFLSDIKVFINNNLDLALTQETNKMIKKKFFPKDKIIRDLYNELFACYYSNLHNASLSVAMELLEYMSKKLYSKVFETEYPKKDWSVVLNKLIKYFEGKKDYIGKEILQYIDSYRKKVRNAQNHGNLLQLVEENTVFYHKAINIFTGEKTEYPLKYKKEIHGESNFLKAKDEIQNQGTNFSIFLTNAFIVHFFVIGKEKHKN
ncbi:MAG: hypothetical protein KAS87_03945 [Candidatus Omnitrophica bacterium]|nr:hypothetical protein [Candidatus Omnitrophota bacterium]